MGDLLNDLKELERTLFLLKYAMERGYQGDAENYAEGLMSGAEEMYENVVKWVEGK